MLKKNRTKIVEHAKSTGGSIINESKHTSEHEPERRLVAIITARNTIITVKI